MRVNLFRAVAAATLWGSFALGSFALVTAGALHAQDSPQPSDGNGSGQRRGGGGGGMRGMAGARGILGTVSEVTAEHYTVKTDSGETYTVHFSANTRILKQPAGAGRQPGQAGERQQGQGGERQQPLPIKSTDIKVGDAITAGGEIDADAKSVGAIFILQLDPERAKEMRAMQANYGKTWLAGRIIKIEDTKITIDGVVDHAPHLIAVDENTSFHKRRDAITLADIKPGDSLRAEGAMKDGAFLATTVNAMEPRTPGERGVRQDRQGTGQGQGNGNGQSGAPGASQSPNQQ
ncbi:DUF5666 domain-containing protein [Acidicapsa ligni]|uniref:DUF5666 domain-containing protein n=1 Tax=Acidicapsa ligni TaxID=542300 RepID=UPI0021E009E2|nr:DUF5666 domain-containing protein [Acidicapsa ligni]